MKPIHSILVLLILAALIIPVSAADDANQTNNAWYWYNKAVDLANAGQFPDALQANEKALAINQSMPVAWANEAGILVQLGRYDDAIAAADKVLSVNSTDMPNTYAAAYYSKGDALRALGRTEEARAAYAQASILDPTLIAPDLSAGTTAVLSPAATGLPPASSVPGSMQTTAAKSPLSLPAVLVSLIGGCALCRFFHRAE